MKRSGPDWVRSVFSASSHRVNAKRKTFLNNVRICFSYPFGILLANNTIGLLANTRKRQSEADTESTVYGTDNPYYHL